MSRYAESRALFFSLARSYELACSAGIGATPLYVVLNEATAAVLADIDLLELDSAQKLELTAEVWDALRDLP